MPFDCSYGTNQYLDETQYDTLTFPLNQIAFLNYAVIEDAPEHIRENEEILEQDCMEKLIEESVVIKKRQWVEQI